MDNIAAIHQINQTLVIVIVPYVMLFCIVVDFYFVGFDFYFVDFDFADLFETIGLVKKMTKIGD